MTDLTLDEVWEHYVDGDPFDHFPWHWQAYLDGEGRPIDIGGISTPNGTRPNGGQHTYWSIAGDIWIATAVLICSTVNAEAHRRYGTPLLSDTELVGGSTP